jgi:hypothetical protein
MVNPQVLPPALLDELQAQQANMVNPQVLPLAVLDELQAQQADMVNPQVLPPALLDQPPEQNKKAKKKPRAQKLSFRPPSQGALVHAHPGLVQTFCAST